jgi:predicted O-linked N-acetylglucosamine transferase (SPINDLY family)
VEALALGMPVVTMPGTHAYGRFTFGLYGELGVHDCIATSSEDYVARAVQLANDADRRHVVRTRITEHAHRMFERKDATLAFARWMTEELPR